MRTHYDNLKVARDAPPEVIRAAYKTLTQKYHPDRSKDPNATKIMAIINEAYEVLSDPKKRILHDQWIKEQESLIKNTETQRRASNSNKQLGDYVLPQKGSLHIDDLDRRDKERLLKRISGKENNQVIKKTDRVIINITWLCAFTLWYAYLYTNANEYRWDEETTYWRLGLTIVATLAISKLTFFVYQWFSSPLGRYLIVAPLYIIRTNFHVVDFWPLTRISDIKGTHNYLNGAYQGTTVTIVVGGDTEEFTVLQKKAYQEIIDGYNKYRNQLIDAINKKNANYFYENDDFFSSREKSGLPHKKRKYKTKALVYSIITLLSLAFFYEAYITNKTRPTKPFKASTSDSQRKYTPHPPKKPAYKRPATAPNGQKWPSVAGYINGLERLNTDGLSSVTVDNSINNSDVFVKLVSLNGSNAYPVRSFFIPAFQTFTLDKVSKGSYDIRYLDLNSGAISKSEAFSLIETKTYNGTEYSNITMTLYKVSNGNMQTYDIDESEF